MTYPLDQLERDSDRQRRSEMHKHWRKTYFSTPSSINHEAYKFWSGEHFNRDRAKVGHLHLDVTHKALAGGRVCEDRQYRQIVTVEDAVAGGCNLFDLDELRLEYSAEEYANLLMCQFIDDTASIFQLANLQRCMVDSWEEWADFKPFAGRPLGYMPVQRSPKVSVGRCGSSSIGSVYRNSRYIKDVANRTSSAERDQAVEMLVDDRMRLSASSRASTS